MPTVHAFLRLRMAFSSFAAGFAGWARTGAIKPKLRQKNSATRRNMRTLHDRPRVRLRTDQSDRFGARILAESGQKIDASYTYSVCKEDTIWWQDCLCPACWKEMCT